MGDRDGRPAPGCVVEGGLDGALGLVVEGAGGLVEDEHRRVAQQRPRDGEPLLLAAGEPVPAGADHGVVAVGEAGEHVVDPRGPAGVLDLGVGRARAGVPQVVAHRRVQQVGVLADHADDLGEVGEAYVAHVDAVDQHPARGRVVQAGDEPGEGGLAAAGLADEGEGACRPARAGRCRAARAAPDAASYANDTRSRVTSPRTALEGARDRPGRRCRWAGPGTRRSG